MFISWKTAVIVLIVAAIAALLLWHRPPPWFDAIPPASPYSSPHRDSEPSVMETCTLPSLANYTPSKPVVAADEAHVVVVAQGMVNDPLRSDMLVWRSSDGGETWNRPDNVAPQARGGEFYFDPWLETDGHGHFYFVYGLSSDKRPMIRRSKDAAQTWSDALPINWKGCDRPVLAISPNGRRLAVAACMGEKSGTHPSRRSGSSNLNLEEKYRAAFRYYAGVFVSRDHGSKWEKWPSPFDNEQAIPFAIVIDDVERVAASWIIAGEGSRSVVSVSENRGRSWATILMAESLQPDRAHPFNGERFPVMALDEQSNLHVAYVATRGTEVIVRRSADWRSWGSAASLSSDAAEEVRMAAIDACGPMVHVTWMERFGASWHAYYRGSRDYGETWSKPCCLSKAIVLLDSSPSGGFQISSDDDQSSVRDDGLGRVHAVWSTRGGGVMHAIVKWSSKAVKAAGSHGPEPVAESDSNGEPPR